MSRGLEIDDGRDQVRASRAPTQELAASRLPHERGRARLPDPRARSATLADRAFTLPCGRERETAHSRRRRDRLRGTESHVLAAAGLFRVVFERDLRETTYRDDPQRLAQDVRHLVRQGLLERHAMGVNHRGQTVAVLNVTKDGQALLERHRGVPQGDRHGPPQATHSGWRRIAEVVHDASVFRMYQVEAARIAAEGGLIQRVVLGDDLKRQCYAAATPAGRASPEDRQVAPAQAAVRLELPVVAGHVEFPDLRLEYDTATGDRTRVDLELVTDAYRPGQIGAKQRAGFTLYSAAGCSRQGIASLGGQARGTSRGSASQDRWLSGLLSL